jgi:hypothetical protein
VPLSLRLSAVALATAAISFAAALPANAAPAECGADSYSYAGVVGATTASGVGALLSSERQTTVGRGHVAGWVGVGGVGLGANATNAWLQVGMSSFESGATALYYEVALPNTPPRYVMLKGHVPVGQVIDVAVLEAQAQPGSWRVWVNGTAMTDAITLPGSHAAWRPTVTAESWSGDRVGACNGYAFRFQHVRVATKPGGGWQPLAEARVISDPGYHLRRGASSLYAAGGSAPN